MNLDNTLPNKFVGYLDYYSIKECEIAVVIVPNGGKKENHLNFKSGVRLF